MYNFKEKDKNLKYFAVLQIILFLSLIFLIISINFHFDFIDKLNNFVFDLIGKIRGKFVNNLMLIITYFGDSIFYIIILSLLLTLFFKRRKIFYPLIFLTLFSAISNSILKNLIMKSRPIGEFVTNLIFTYNFPSSFSFPSGHTQTALVFYFILTHILLNNFYNGKHRKLYLSLSIVFSILIMLSRLVLGVHFFTDIIGGTIIAIIIILNYLYINNKQVIK